MTRPLNAKARFVSDNCFAASLIEAARQVTAIYDTALRPAGINVTQFNMLAAITLLQPETISALAAAIGMERSTASRNLAVLKRNGWIERREANGGPRSGAISLSPGGRAVFELAFPLWSEAQEHLAQQLGTDQTAAYRDVLKQVRATLGDDAD
ncbi:MarR family winged helix-turn-helix transcriptional regulator [Erythrobacter mangrovi]|uniref:Winged helix-turn-helix transcriptional regulator n=1 Tax=Erythrobacter mangrovi TaxID=2739433 RepID=A0A7D3XGP6_9SPHN|nr:MarR family winged helix-turn-helix transcriptional regulator [Erythrobacter mangrovi]QKG70633.1 winged helix-turn-helix transcriptional regulator [Erythrobacter mangrovi]